METEENIYANVDNTMDEIQKRRRGTQGPGSPSAERHIHRLAVLCLGLLCFLLLTALIALAVYHSRVTHHAGIEQNNLRKERDQLLLNYSLQTAERDQLLLNYSLQTAERDQLLMKFDKCCNKNGGCPSGWSRLNTSCYYISNEKKTWNDSRQACKQLGADLAIISSREEQDFFEHQSGYFWIGLSDRESEGTWKWVDGTTIPVEKGYWRANPQQPDNYEGNEDCVEFSTIFSVPFQRWNDRPCNDAIQWICESVPKC